ncbi:MAG: class I SAM-dependent methyltransferase [Acidimicrobiales bacterium]
MSEGAVLASAEESTQTEVGEDPEPTEEVVEAPLLLHSLAEFRELIQACLDASGAKTVVEIGAEAGAFTRELLVWAEASDARLFCVDPAPSQAMMDLVTGSERAELILERSLDALGRLEPCDAYLIDGDHNYYTVDRELRTITDQAEASGQHPLIFLHDVGWPSGRRDMYYSPQSIPSAGRHEHTYDGGTVPGRSDLVEGGFRGEGQFAWARHEGGPRNGVRTAVEDFLGDHPGLVLADVPCVFGLGVVYPRSAPYAAAVAEILEPYDGDVLLRRLEENRLTLYLRVLEMQDDMAGLHRVLAERHDDLCELHRELERSSLYVRDVEVENRALRGRVGELEEKGRRHDELVQEVQTVVRSRSIVTAEWTSRLLGRLRNRPTLSLGRLRALAEQDRT